MTIKNAIPYWKSGHSVVLVNSEGLEPKKDRTIRSYNPPVGGKKTATRFFATQKKILWPGALKAAGELTPPIQTPNRPWFSKTPPGWRFKDSIYLESTQNLHKIPTLDYVPHPRLR